MTSDKKRLYTLCPLTIVLFLASVFPSVAQSNRYEAHGWQLMDRSADSVFGASVNKAYTELLKGKQAHPVVVAVIDGGVDTAHEDLAGHIWTNRGEIPGNGIDDDHNGYIDDVHGWNFLGGRDGKNIQNESFESAREYFRILHDTAAAPGDGGAYREKVRKYFLQDSLMQAQSVQMLSQIIPQMQSADSVLKISMHKDSIYARDLYAYQPTDSNTAMVKKNTLQYFKKYGITADMSLGRFIQEAIKYQKTSGNNLLFFSGDPNAQRALIVGDDWNNINDKNYGNNNVSAGNPSHGTHVAGIIAATRDNGKGMDGIDEQVYIMALRAVPDGDERDKDIALAIRYAVDNGARIVNMSFGKYLSPGKKWVDEAVKYAEAHNVLLIHAAGNESRDIDSVENYPNPKYAGEGKKSATWINVGATNGGPDSLILARFSNYGKTEVDLFAPGVRIYSTVYPNQYAAYSGTSMAAPVVTGVAALIMEYYPDLTATQVKYILVHSVVKLSQPWVKWINKGKTVDFNQLSATGGIVNAYNALIMAASMKGEQIRQQ